MNGNRKITGVLRGYDPFMNVVLDDVLDETVPNAREELGMVVCQCACVCVCAMRRARYLTACMMLCVFITSSSHRLVDRSFVEIAW